MQLALFHVPKPSSKPVSLTSQQHALNLSQADRIMPLCHKNAEGSAYDASHGRLCCPATAHYNSAATRVATDSKGIITADSTCSPAYLDQGWLLIAQAPEHHALPGGLKLPPQLHAAQACALLRCLVLWLLVQHFGRLCGSSLA